MDFIERTLGITKGEPMSIEVAQWANPDYEPETPFAWNCFKCVMAYELRRRGYNVVAQPAEHGRLNELNMLDENGKQPEFIEVDSRRYLISEIAKQTYGTRNMVYVIFGEDDIDHVFIAENVDGKVRFIDPQNPNASIEANFIRALKDGLAYLPLNNIRFDLTADQLHKLVRRADNET